jgi:hypothetical protein
MSDTPETDKLANKGLHELSYISQMTDWARTLERERDEARKDLEFRRELYTVLERERDEANEELHKQLIRYDALFDESEKIRTERDEAQKECLEQAQLLGKGAERELILIAKLREFNY